MIYVYGSSSGRVFIIKVFRPGPFIEPQKGEVQGFWGRTEVEPGSNRDNVIINLIIILNIYKNIKLIKKNRKIN